MSQPNSTTKKTKPSKKRMRHGAQHVSYEEKSAGPELTKRNGYEDIGYGCYRRRTTARD